MREVLGWIRAHKASTAALVLVVAGCLALVLLARRVHHLRPPPAESTRAAAAAATAAVAVAVGDGPGPTPSDRAGTEHDARSARMRAEFEGAPAYLAFIQQAMSRPQEGGKFYALLAWQRCADPALHGGEASAYTGSDTFHDAALARMQELGRRCAGVLDTWSDLPALYRVAVEQRGGRDFLMPVDGRGLVVPAARETAGADIDAALATGDRWAAAEALRGNAAFLDVGNSAGDDGANRQLREWGAEIVACELVASCRGGLEAALHCVASGDCAHDDYRDVVLARVPEPQRVFFDTVLVGLHARMGLAAGRPDAPDRP